MIISDRKKTGRHPMDYDSIRLSYLLLAAGILALLLLLLPSGRVFAKKSSKKISISNTQGADGKYYADGTYTFQLKNAKSKITWSVDKPKLASIKKKKGNKAELIPNGKSGTVTIKAVCSNKTYKKKVKLKKARMKISKTALYPGLKCDLTLSGASKNIKWSVSKTSIASVKKSKKNKAKLTLKKTGKVTVKAKFKGITYRMQLSVQPGTLSPGSLNFQDSSPKKLTFKGAKTSPRYEVTNWDSIGSVSGGKDVIYWAINDPKIVSITPDGATSVLVTPKRTGATTIAVNYLGYPMYVSVNVGTDPGYVIPDLYGKDAELADLSLPDLQLPSDIPDYWKDELANSIATVTRRAELAGNMSMFLFITDSHWGLNAKRSPAIINYLSKNLDFSFTLIGGDVVTSFRTGLSSKGLTGAQRALNDLNNFFQKFDSSVRLMITVGNHDVNSESDNDSIETDRLSEAEVYDAMITKSGPGINTEPGELHSWTDDTTHKIRYISFYYDRVHTSGITDEKLAWVDQKVKELDSSWTVVLFSHAYWSGSSQGKTIKVTAPAKKLARHLANLDSQSDAKIALWMFGHCHRDYNDRIVSDDGRSEINAVSTNCDCYYPTKSEKWGAAPMTLNTSTEQAMDLVQIDTNNHKIYLTRVGAGGNRILSY